MFKAYLSIANQMMNDPLSEAPLQLRSQIQSSGVSVTDVPGGKDVADKMLIGKQSWNVILECWCSEESLAGSGYAGLRL